MRSFLTLFVLLSALLIGWCEAQAQTHADYAVGVSGGDAYIRRDTFIVRYTSLVFTGITDANVIATGDLNGDGYLDLIFARDGWSSAYVYFNRGDGSGSFYLAGLLAASGNGPPSYNISGIEVADFNGDGANDVAIAVTGDNVSADGQLTVWFNNGVGNFTSVVSLKAPTQVNGSIGSLARYFSVVAGDFNNDGFIDLAAGRLSNIYINPFPIGLPTYVIPEMVIFPNAGGVGAGWQGFSGPIVAELPNSLNVSTIPDRIATGDFDGDGFLDIVVGTRALGRLAIIRNINFQLFPSQLQLNGTIRGLSTGDFNRDGVTDIVIALDRPGTADVVQIQVGAGNGTGFTGYELPVCANPNSLVSKDFNGDLLQDIIVSCGGSNQLQANYGTLSNWLNFDVKLDPTVRPPLAVQVADFQVPYSSRPDPNSSSVQYSLWNGFLGMTNILELVNNSDTAKAVRVSVFRLDGSLGVKKTYQVAARAQQDIIVNSLAGFGPNSYGIVTVEGAISGRMFYYRTAAPGFDSFEFAFGIPFSRPLFGRNFVGFNTFQPSNNPADFASPVLNWLSVVNLSNTSQRFLVEKFSQDGQLLSQNEVDIGAYGRSDLDGGHGAPGPSNVGLLRVTPTNANAPYLSQLVRYGTNSRGGYDFAFPLLAGPGKGNPVHTPLSTINSSQNWLEVVNTSEAPTNVSLKVYSPTGQLLRNQTLLVGARSQQHLDMLSVLGKDKNAYATVDGVAANSVIAQSMVYFRNPANGSILSMYGSQAQEVTRANNTGSFNLFLGMQNLLKLSNISGSSATVDLTISSLFSPGSSRTISIPANQTVTLSLHDTATFGTAVDSYGAVLVESRNGVRILPEIVRFHPSPIDGLMDFAAPTELR